MQLIKKHPITIFFYLLYLAILYSDIARTQAYTQTGHAPCGIPGTFLFAPMFGFVIAINAIGRSADQTKFYLCILALIIIPPVILSRF